MRHVVVACFALDVILHSNPIFEYQTLSPVGLTGGRETFMPPIMELSGCMSAEIMSVTMSSTVISFNSWRNDH